MDTFFKLVYQKVDKNYLNSVQTVLFTLTHFFGGKKQACCCPYVFKNLLRYLGYFFTFCQITRNLLLGHSFLFSLAETRYNFINFTYHLLYTFQCKIFGKNKCWLTLVYLLFCKMLIGDIFLQFSKYFRNFFWDTLFYLF